MNIEIDHPTLTHMLGYLNVNKWVSAIRNKEVNIDIAWELLRIQDRAYHGCMVEEVEELVNMSSEEYKEYLKMEGDIDERK
jgi:hypothetical protein